jgi:hypothetical protein
MKKSGLDFRVLPLFHRFFQSLDCSVTELKQQINTLKERVMKKEIREHPFKTLAFFTGGIKNLLNLLTDNSKKLKTGGG